MRFHKGVSEKKQYYLTETLKRYKEEKTMTSSEQASLHNWVAKGNDPYTNGYGYCFENSRQMDYLEAERIIQELSEQTSLV